MTRAQECDAAIVVLTAAKATLTTNGNTFGAAQVQKVIDAVTFEKNRGS